MGWRYSIQWLPWHFRNSAGHLQFGTQCFFSYSQLALLAIKQKHSVRIICGLGPLLVGINDPFGAVIFLGSGLKSVTLSTGFVYFAWQPVSRKGVFSSLLNNMAVLVIMSFFMTFSQPSEDPRSMDVRFLLLFFWSLVVPSIPHFAQYDSFLLIFQTPGVLQLREDFLLYPAGEGKKFCKRGAEMSPCNGKEWKGNHHLYKVLIFTLLIITKSFV